MPCTVYNYSQHTHAPPKLILLCALAPTHTIGLPQTWASHSQAPASPVTSSIDGNRHTCRGLCHCIIPWHSRGARCCAVAVKGGGAISGGQCVDGQFWEGKHTAFCVKNRGGRARETPGSRHPITPLRGKAEWPALVPPLGLQDSSSRG